MYTGEVFSNVDGGLREGTRYLDNLDLTLTVDGAAAFGAEGLTLFAYGLYNNGKAVSRDLVGDAQGVSNIEAVRAVRLYELWADQELELGSVRLGLYDLNSEFDAIETAGLFLNPSHGIGAELGQTGLQGPSIFPVTSLGVRFAVPIAGSLIRFAALDGVPGDPKHPKRTTIRFDDGDGALLAGEVEHRSERGCRAALGVWHYTGRQQRVHDRVVGAAGPKQRGNSGVYGFVEGPLWRGASADRGLAGFLRVGVADARVNAVSSYVGAGLTYTGLLSGRAEDQLGIAVATARFGQEFLSAQRAEGNAWHTSEVNLELTYRFPVTPWLTLQPDLQYVVNPGGNSALDDALVIGLRFELAASFSE